MSENEFKKSLKVDIEKEKSTGKKIRKFAYSGPDNPWVEYCRQQQFPDGIYHCFDVGYGVSGRKSIKSLNIDKKTDEDLKFIDIGTIDF